MGHTVIKKIFLFACKFEFWLRLSRICNLFFIILPYLVTFIMCWLQVSRLLNLTLRYFSVLQFSTLSSKFFNLNPGYILVLCFLNIIVWYFFALILIFHSTHYCYISSISLWSSKDIFNSPYQIPLHYLHSFIHIRFTSYISPFLYSLYSMDCLSSSSA